MKLSIVIPVYNVEKYLAKCLNSCINQDLSKDDYEIIVVNDGSPDNCLSIAERIAESQPNIIILSQENQGLSGARNTGLSRAKGDYVWFIDSDDWIEENCLGKIVESMVDCDMLAIDYIWAYDDSSKNQTVSYGKTGSIPGREFLMDKYRVQAQMYIYRRQFIIDNNLEFYRGVYHEDTEFTPRALYLAKNVRYLNVPVYYFYKRPNSISTVPNPKRAFDYITVSNSLNKFVERVDVGYKCCFYNQIARNISNALSVISQAENQKKEEFYIALMNNKDVLKAMEKSTNRSRRLMGKGLSCLPRLSYKILVSMKTKNVE